MASFVTDEGRVIPPLNISAPAPLINLRGFNWDTVDAVIHGPQPGQDDVADKPTEDDEQPQTHEPFAAPPSDDGPPLLQDMFAAAQPEPIALGGPGGPAGPGRPGRPGGPIAAPQPVPLPAPQAPLSPEALGTQLPVQLGFKTGQQASAPPLFPLAQFQGAFAGNGFNMIFRPRPNNDETVFPTSPVGPADNVLELNLTTEQLTFGRTIGKIPNRGLNLNNQADISLGGLPYLQTIQDVTNTVTGRGDRANPVDIHFEPGMWLNVPATSSPENGPSVVRMASIPHGTTINAQCPSPPQAKTTLGGEAKGPTFAVIDTTPFSIGNPSARVVGVFKSMDATQTDTPRIPQKLETYVYKNKPFATQLTSSG